MQPRGASADRGRADLEQVFYVLEGGGVAESGGESLRVTEGDMLHLPAGTDCRLVNPNEEWLAYLVMAA